MSRAISDVIRIMRLAIGRRNENDPDSDDATLLQYINDFMALSMSDELKIHEQWQTMEFSIDDTLTDGVVAFPGSNSSNNFVNISDEIMIVSTDPAGQATDWRALRLWRDPGAFYGKWGINNETDLVAGPPTDVLYYGNEFVFRTIPDDSYDVKFYAYSKVAEVASGDDLAFDYWMRFVAYGAAKQYAADYRLNDEAKKNIDVNFARERKLLLARQHNRVRDTKVMPRF